MAKWWEVLVHYLWGPNSNRPPSPEDGQVMHDPERERIKKIADQAARDDAKRRVAALDLRVDVLSRRMTDHERKKSH